MSTYLNKKNRILMLAYFFSPEDGVGSFRSQSLYKFLRGNGFMVHCISKYAWGKGFANNILVWSLMCVFYIFKNRNLFDKIYISCGPFEPLMLITIASYLVKKPLIVDFRDPWSLNIETNYGNENQKLSFKRRFQLILSRFIERLTYNICQYFVVCTEGMYIEYNKLFSDNTKIRLITNGYDFDPRQYKMVCDCREEVRFVCIGKFAEYSKDKALFILSEIKRFGEINKCPVKVIFIGSDREQNDPLIKQMCLNAEWYPRLPYNKALKIAVEADFGLCLLRSEMHEYGTKVFDYIGLGVPVFDYFNEDNNFRNYFELYLSNKLVDKFGRIPYEKRLRFSRKQIFGRNIDIFE